ncbi:MAG TPA: hypothetical protein VN923_00135 [Thermoanaerobaculia bacterium]|nr:hypothetical protein [Thermoanaerobaculia bacterium]
MESWLILMGVLLPLVPLLQIADRRLSEPGPRRAPVRVKPNRA